MKKLILPLLPLMTVATAHAASIHTGLLSYWDFEGDYNDGAGSIAGNANTVDDNGTAGSAVSLTAGGPIGQYGDFARTGLGTDNVVAVPASADIDATAESLTVSAWFRVDGFDQGWQGLVAHGEGNAWRIARRATENTLGYAGGTGDIPSSNNSGPDINDGSWHNIVAITEAGVSTRLWMDGVLIGTGGVPTLANNGSTQLFIGGNPQGNATNTNVNQFRPWNGAIDELAIWDRPLTEAEIGTLFASGSAGVPLSGIIPEPSSLVLGLLGFSFLARRRR